MVLLFIVHMYDTLLCIDGFAPQGSTQELRTERSTARHVRRDGDTPTRETSALHAYDVKTEYWVACKAYKPYRALYLEGLPCACLPVASCAVREKHHVLSPVSPTFSYLVS